MNAKVRVLGGIGLISVLLGAGPGASPDALVREGNEAVREGAPEQALAMYTQAEERTTDPGLVAFNKGVALYQQGQYDQAAYHFRLAREGATGPRLWCALYNRGTSLVQEARNEKAQQLEEAIAAYQECLRQDGLSRDMRNAARHNLELAKLLWVEAKARPTRTGEDNQPRDDKPDPPKPPERNGQPPEVTPGTGQDTGEKRPVEVTPGDQQVTQTEEKKAGAGNIQVIPDAERLMPMSAEEAAQHLKMATQRILDERRAHQRSLIKPPRNTIPDW